MIRFLCGAAIVYLLLVASAYVLRPPVADVTYLGAFVPINGPASQGALPKESWDAGVWAANIAKLVLVPLLVSWAAAEGMRLLSPRRVLDARVRMPARRLLAGVASGVIAVLLMCVAMLIPGQPAPDLALVAGGPIIGAVAVLLLSSRVRAGRCVHCGYDLSGMTVRAAGMCVECGQPVM